MIKYTVAAFQHEALVRDEKGFNDYSSAIMQGNIWRRNGVMKISKNAAATVNPEEIIVFSVDDKNKHEIVRSWRADQGGVL